MSELRCDSCHRLIAPGSGYCVKIEAFADRETPAISTDAGAAGENEIADLLEQMRDMTAEELQDGVHRAFEFRICPDCHRDFLTNPLGRPRRGSAGAAEAARRN